MSTAANVPLESAIQTACLRYLRRLARGKWLKAHATQYGVLGTPDLIGCYHGQTFLFEVKRPGEVPTRRQDEEIRQWQRAGAIVAVVTSPAECRSFLRPWLAGSDQEVVP